MPGTKHRASSSSASDPPKRRGRGRPPKARKESQAPSTAPKAAGAGRGRPSGGHTPKRARGRPRKSASPPASSREKSLNRTREGGGTPRNRGSRRASTATPATDDSGTESRSESSEDTADSGSDTDCGCCGDGGDLVCCSDRRCPKVYHAACVGVDPEDDEEWYCPKHWCALTHTPSRRVPSELRGSSKPSQPLRGCGKCPTALRQDVAERWESWWHVVQARAAIALQQVEKELVPDSEAEKRAQAARKRSLRSRRGGGAARGDDREPWDDSDSDDDDDDEEDEKEAGSQNGRGDRSSHDRWRCPCCVIPHPRMRLARELEKIWAAIVTQEKTSFLAAPFLEPVTDKFAASLYEEAEQRFGSSSSGAAEAPVPPAEQDWPNVTCLRDLLCSIRGLKYASVARFHTDLRSMRRVVDSLCRAHELATGTTDDSSSSSSMDASLRRACRLARGERESARSPTLWEASDAPDALETSAGVVRDACDTVLLLFERKMQQPRQERLLRKAERAIEDHTRLVASWHASSPASLSRRSTAGSSGGKGGVFVADNDGDDEEEEEEEEEDAEGGITGGSPGPLTRREKEALTATARPRHTDGGGVSPTQRAQHVLWLTLERAEELKPPFPRKSPQQPPLGWALRPGRRWMQRAYTRKSLAYWSHRLQTTVVRRKEADEGEHPAASIKEWVEEVMAERGPPTFARGSGGDAAGSGAGGVPPGVAPIGLPLRKLVDDLSSSSGSFSRSSDSSSFSSGSPRGQPRNAMSGTVTSPISLSSSSNDGSVSREQSGKNGEPVGQVSQKQLEKIVQKKGGFIAPPWGLWFPSLDSYAAWFLSDAGKAARAVPPGEEEEAAMEAKHALEAAEWSHGRGLKRSRSLQSDRSDGEGSDADDDHGDDDHGVASRSQPRPRRGPSGGIGAVLSASVSRLPSARGESEGPPFDAIFAEWASNDRTGLAGVSAFEWETWFSRQGKVKGSLTARFPSDPQRRGGGAQPATNLQRRNKRDLHRLSQAHGMAHLSLVQELAAADKDASNIVWDESAQAASQRSTRRDSKTPAEQSKRASSIPSLPPAPSLVASSASSTPLSRGIPHGRGARLMGSWDDGPPVDPETLTDALTMALRRVGAASALDGAWDATEGFGFGRMASEEAGGWEGRFRRTAPPRHKAPTGPPSGGLASMAEGFAAATLSEMAEDDVDGPASRRRVDDLLGPAPGDVDRLLGDLSRHLRRAMRTSALLREAWEASRRNMVGVFARTGYGPGNDPQACDMPPSASPTVTLGEGRLAAEVAVANRAMQARLRRLYAENAALRMQMQRQTHAGDAKVRRSPAAGEGDNGEAEGKQEVPMEDAEPDETAQGREPEVTVEEDE